MAAKRNRMKETESKFHRHFLLTILTATGLAFFWVVRFFLVPVAVAATLSSIFYPLYKYVNKKFKDRQGLSSIVTTLFLFAGLLLPLVLIGNLVSEQAVELYHNMQKLVEKIIEEGEKGIIGDIKRSDFLMWLRFQDIELENILQQSLQAIGSATAKVINTMSKGVLRFVTNILIIFFTMFYFFRDGHKVVNKLKDISPMNEKYEQAVINRFGQISGATIKGTLLVGLTQGAIGGVTFLVLSIESWLLWGVVMVILSIVPLVGAYVVMVPAGIFQLLVGNIVKGIVILVMGTVVIGSVDNLMRPRLVGKGAKMHDLVIFFSTLGGLAVFGPLGFIVGPLIAAMFQSILEIYTVEFKGELELPKDTTLD